MKQNNKVGYGAIGFLGDILQREQPKHVMVVTGKDSYKTSGAKKEIEKHLKDYVRFSEFGINTELSDMVNGLNLARENNADLIIGIGGGSVIDTAKAIAVFYGNDGNPEDYVKKKLKLEQKGLPTVMIPTTAGTGSEATHFSVVYIDGKKYSLANREFMLPEYAIVDPQLSLNLPPHLTANTGMDALSQAIESFWSINATKQSQACSRIALQLLKDNFMDVFMMSKENGRYVRKEGGPLEEGREAIAKAAYYAGKAINTTFTTAPHAVSYILTYQYGVTHGQAVGLTLPHFFEFNYDVKDDSECNGCLKAKEVKQRMEEICGLLGIPGVEHAKMKFQNLMLGINMDTRLREVHNFTEESIDELVEGFNEERGKNNPRKVTKDQLRILLEKAY